ncbi:MAG: flavodoxin family protein [Candidatus Bathyarchaeia archaeon]
MRILGISCGSKLTGKLRPGAPIGGNTEVLVKEALMGAEEVGAEVEFIRLLDLDIRPCIHCEQCLWTRKGPEFCVIKDDAPFLYDRIMECDGLILGAPVYSKRIPGYLEVFHDRALGPKADVAFLMEMKKAGGVDRAGQPVRIDERAFKRRVGGLITNGGSITPAWLAFDLTMLHLFMFSEQIQIVDQVRFIGVGQWGHVVLNEKWLERARQLGRNVAEALKKPPEEVKWMGEPGVCPVCHCNLIIITGRENFVECPVCGITGKLKVENNKIIVDFPETEQKRSVLTIEGKREHWFELKDNLKIAMQRPGRDQIPQKLEKYMGYAESLIYKLWLKRKTESQKA